MFWGKNVAALQTQDHYWIQSLKRKQGE